MRKVMADSMEVLVVVDDALQREGICTAIHEGVPELTVQTATSGDDVIERIGDMDIDGVLCSTELTGRSPVSLVRRLSATHGNLPVLLLTTDSTGHDTITAAIDAGVTDIFPQIETPEEGQLVAKRIKDALSRANHVSHSAGTLRSVSGHGEGREHLTWRERRFRLIAEHIDEVIFLGSLDPSEVLYINPAYEDIVGRPVDELYEDAEQFHDYLHPADRDEYLSTLHEMKAGIKAGTVRARYEVDFRVQRPDGDVRWVEAIYYPIRTDADSDDLYVGVCQDITEQKKLREDLDERERHFRLIAEHIDEVIYLGSLDLTEVLYINPAYEDIVGRPVDELYEDATQALDYLHPDDRYEYISTLQQMQADVKEGKARDRYELTCRVCRPDDEIRWVEVTGYPVLTDDGRADLVGVVKDVTERKKRERELRETEEQFQLVTENVDELIFLSRGIVGCPDAYDGKPPDVEPLYMSPAYEDIYGRSVEEVYEDPSTLQAAVHPDDREAYVSTLARMVEDARQDDPQDVYEMTFRIQRPDGDVRWVEGNIYPVAPADDEPYRWVGISRDITGQKRRKKTLETFHEATRELTEARSREAASRTAVEAATDVLGFPLVGVYLFDESTTELQPVAATDHLGEPASLRAFSPGENLSWQVFVDGEVLQTESVDANVFATGTPDPDLLLPLGSHGMMLVGTLDEGLDAETVDFAQILAATVEVALNHVEGKREIERREEELRLQQVRAERLDRLNTVIRDIEQVTVEKSGTEELLEAVCDRLTDVEPYQVAWVGDPSVPNGRDIRASAGDRAYVESIDTADDIRGRHPAVEAYETVDVQAVRRIATDKPHEAWEKRALRRGYQAVVAVPLEYEDTIHGVLSVAADTPTAFDQEEQTILSELGRSIGYELTVRARERALESDTTTELEFNIADDGLLLAVVSDMASCRVELEQTVSRSDGTFSLFCIVEGIAPEEAIGVAKQASAVVDIEIISDTGEETGLLEIKATDWFGSLFTQHGAILRTAWAEDGTGRLLFEVPGTVAISDIVEAFKEQYPNTELLAKRKRERPVRTLLELQDALQERLTDRQLEVLKMAYSAGYFEWPRGASGEEIADLLGITQPTFNKHLRTAEREAFTLLLDRYMTD